MTRPVKVTTEIEGVEYEIEREEDGSHTLTVHDMIYLKDNGINTLIGFLSEFGNV